MIIFCLSFVYLRDFRYSCAEDLSKFLQFLFSAQRSVTGQPSPSTPQSTLLSPERIRWWLKPHVWNDDGASGWGRPWEILANYGPDSRTTLFTKDGGISGYLSEVGLIPELQVGYIAFQSSFGSGYNHVVEQLREVMAGPIADAIQSAGSAETPQLPPNVNDLVGDYLLLDLHVSGPKTYHVRVGDVNTTGRPMTGVLLLDGWSTPPPALFWQPNHPVPDTFSTVVLNNVAVSGPCSNYQQGAPGFVQFVRADNGTVTGLSFPGLWYGTVVRKI